MGVVGAVGHPRHDAVPGMDFRHVAQEWCFESTFEATFEGCLNLDGDSCFHGWKGDRLQASRKDLINEVMGIEKRSRFRLFGYICCPIGPVFQWIESQIPILRM